MSNKNIALYEWDIYYILILWQEFQYANETFEESGEDKEWDFDVEEIREVLDD